MRAGGKFLPTIKCFGGGELIFGGEFVLVSRGAYIRGKLRLIFGGGLYSGGLIFGGLIFGGLIFGILLYGF